MVKSGTTNSYRYIILQPFSREFVSIKKHRIENPVLISCELESGLKFFHRVGKNRLVLEASFESLVANQLFKKIKIFFQLQFF